MFLTASRAFHIDISKTVFIGDDERDGVAANNVRCTFIRKYEEMSLWGAVTQIIG